MSSSLSPNRRRLIAALAAYPAVNPLRSGAAQRGPTIDVKSLGAFGDGRRPDALQIKEAIRRAADSIGGATVFFPPGEYFLGNASDSVLVAAEGLRDVRFVGEKATLTCRSITGSSTMLELVGCRNVAVEGLAFRDHGLKRDVNWLGAAAIRLSNLERAGCEDIQIRDCRFDSVLTAVVCRRTEGNLRLRSRRIRLTDLTVRRSYYGFSFQDNGDDVVGRGLRCDDVKRSYFPFGVSNHDIELDTANNTTGFTDVLIKCYHGDTRRIKVAVRCRGKRSGDAIVALDQQHEQGQGTIRDVDLTLDVDDVDCRLDTAVLIRSLDRNGHGERQTKSRWDEIAIDGDVRICDKTKLLDIATLQAVPGTLRIGRKLATNPRLPSTFPGFRVVGL
jgi:hypothetical protein